MTFTSVHADTASSIDLMIEITRLLQLAMLRSDIDNDAIPAVVIAVRQAKRAGVNPAKIVVLDTDSTVTLRSMQNTIERYKQEIEDQRTTVLKLNDRIEELLRQRNNGTSWEDHLRLKAAKLWIERKRLNEVAEDMSEELGREVTPNMLTQQFYNEPPPAGLKAVVRRSGTPDWPELWKLGASLREGTTNTGRRERGWKGVLARELGYQNGKLPFKVGCDLSNTSIDMTFLNAIRDRYLGPAGGEYRGFMKRTIAAKIKEAGENGIPRKDLLDAGLDQRRMVELVQAREIIDISDDDAPRYVHISFRPLYEEAYQRQERTLTNRALSGDRSESEAEGEREREPEMS